MRGFKMTFAKLRGSVWGKLLIFPLVVGAFQLYELLDTYPNWDYKTLIFGFGLLPLRWAAVSVIPMAIYKFRPEPLSKVASCIFSAMLIPVNTMLLFLVSVVPFRSFIVGDDATMPVHVSVALVNSIIGGLFVSYYVFRQERNRQT